MPVFSQTSEYALRVIVCLAQRSQHVMTTERIAEITILPRNYLAKVLLTLARANLVVSQRGLHGGHKLARSATTITVLDVLNAVEPFRRLETCPLGLPEHGSVLCPLHRRLDDALGLIQNLFASSTIDQLMREPSSSTPLCSHAQAELLSGNK